MITAKDVAAGEETYFTCFYDNDQYIGTYKDVLLRAAMAAVRAAGDAQQSEHEHRLIAETIGKSSRLLAHGNLTDAHQRKAEIDRKQPHPQLLFGKQEIRGLRQTAPERQPTAVN